MAPASSVEYYLNNDRLAAMMYDVVTLHITTGLQFAFLPVVTKIQVSHPRTKRIVIKYSQCQTRGLPSLHVLRYA